MFCFCRDLRGILIPNKCTTLFSKSHTHFHSFNTSTPIIISSTFCETYPVISTDMSLILAVIFVNPIIPISVPFAAITLWLVGSIAPKPLNAIGSSVISLPVSSNIRCLPVSKLASKYTLLSLSSVLMPLDDLMSPLSGLSILFLSGHARLICPGKPQL